MILAQPKSENGTDSYQYHCPSPALARRAANRRAGHHFGGSNEQEKNLWDLCAR
jgi:hypothetical protein